jgi:hypothetical protein
MARKDSKPQTAPVATPVITDEDLLSPGVTDAPAPVVETPNVDAPVVSAPPTGGVFMTAADIAEIVRAAVAGVSAAGSQATADVLAKALTQHMGPRRLTVAELGEPKTPFNPTGAKRELKCEFFQNSAPINERYVSDGEIEMLHKLTPGSYGTPELPIAVVEKKRLNGKTRVFIIHSDTKDDRLRMKTYAPTFHAMLLKLVQEAKEQRSQRRAEARALLEEDI